MSSDIFIFIFRQGDTVPIPRALFAEVFGRNAVDFSPEHVRYPDGSGGEICCAETDPIESLGFDHCGGDMFFDAMFELIDRADGTVIWRGTGPNIALPRRELIDHLPEGLHEESGPAFIVTTRKELCAAVFSP